MQDFHKLQVWQRAHDLVLEAYKATNRLPEKRYPGLNAQLRRAASSIPTNIAEGCGHDTQREFARFLQISLASANELQYHLKLSHDLELLAGPEYAKLDARTEQVKQMLGALLRKVRAQPFKLPPRTGSSTT